MALVLKQFPIGPMANFGYLIGDDATREAIVVDPAWSPEEILKVAEASDLKLVGMAVTHAHFDHTNAIELLLHKVDVPVYAHPEEIAYAMLYLASEESSFCTGSMLVVDGGMTAW